MLDFTHDWSMAVTVKVQGQGVQGSILTTFGNGTSTFNLEVQGTPIYNSSFGAFMDPQLTILMILPRVFRQMLAEPRQMIIFCFCLHSCNQNAPVLPVILHWATPNVG